MPKQQHPTRPWFTVTPRFPAPRGMPVWARGQSEDAALVQLRAWIADEGAVYFADDVAAPPTMADARALLGRAFPCHEEPPLNMSVGGHETADERARATKRARNDAFDVAAPLPVEEIADPSTRAWVAADFRVDPYGNVIARNAVTSSPFFFDVDHWVLPWARGGFSHRDQLRAVQFSANRSKGAAIGAVTNPDLFACGVPVGLFLRMLAEPDKLMWVVRDAAGAIIGSVSGRALLGPRPNGAPIAALPHGAEADDETIPVAYDAPAPTAPMAPRGRAAVGPIIDVAAPRTPPSPKAKRHIAWSPASRGEVAVAGPRDDPIAASPRDAVGVVGPVDVKVVTRRTSRARAEAAAAADGADSPAAWMHRRALVPYEELPFDEKVKTVRVLRFPFDGDPGIRTRKRSNTILAVMRAVRPDITWADLRPILLCLGRSIPPNHARSPESIAELPPLHRDETNVQKTMDTKFIDAMLHSVELTLRSDAAGRADAGPSDPSRGGGYAAPEPGPCGASGGPGASRAGHDAKKCE